MKKPLVFVVAGLAALTGCQTGSSSKAERRTAPSSSTVTQQQPAPESSQGSRGQQSGSLGSGTDLASGPGSAGSLDGSSAAAAKPSAEPSADQSAGPGSATSEIGASTPSASTTPTPGSDEKSPDQRGSVLTNDGAVLLRGNVGGSQSSAAPSTGDAATSAAVDSLHIDHADSATAQPPLGDQATLGFSESDRQLVQRIRQSVVDDETISSEGRSVQIQSLDGQIVLKGQVGSLREKQRIGDTAFRESGGKMVVNQLEVRNQSPSLSQQ